MLHKTKGVVLHNINYSETSIISRIYTREFGLQSFLVNGVRKGKGAIRPAHLMPMNLVDMVVYQKEGAGLQRIRELRCDPPLHTLPFDVVKNSIGMFLCELLGQSIDGDDSNPDLYDFVESFITILDLEEEHLANHPIWFMIQLSKYLGFAPKQSPEKGWVFNYNEGEFSPTAVATNACMSEVNSGFFAEMLQTPIDELDKIRIPKNVRISLLDDLLIYYNIHVLNGRQIRSHEVFRTLFG